MKVLILGTSNSILKRGWVKGLRLSLPNAVIDNFSIGASPGTQFSARDDIDYKNYDYILFDSIPNDQEYFEEKDNQWGYDINFYNEIMIEIIKYISILSKIIIIGITREKTFDSESLIYNEKKYLCENTGMYFLDTKKILKIFCKKIGINESIIYDYHPSHPDSELMRLIGYYLGLLILSNSNNDEKNFRSSNYPFAVWRGNKSSKSNIYKNSLVSDVFFELEGGSSIFFEEQKIIGFYINTNNTNCIISIKNDGIILMNISLYYEKFNGVMKLFIPIPYGVLANEIYVNSNPVDADYFAMGSQKTSLYKEINFCVNSISFYKKPSENIFFKREKFIVSDENNSKLIDKTLCDNKFFLIHRHESQSILDTLYFYKKNISKNDLFFSILTYKDTVVFYDIVKKNFIHDYLEASETKNIHEVFFKVKNLSEIEFYIKIDNLYFYINPFQKESIIYIEYNYGRISFKSNGCYMCADYNGIISSNREKFDRWEMFDIVPVIPRLRTC